MTTALVAQNALQAAGVTCEGVSPAIAGAPTPSGSVLVTRADGLVFLLHGVPAAQQALATSTVQGLDLTPAGQTAADTSQQRTQASTTFDGADALAKALKGTAAVLVDEINILRAQVVGVGTVVFNPGAMANGTGKTSANVTVTGVAFGDFVDVAAPYTLAGCQATGYVVSANTVAIRVDNSTGGSVTLASGTWNVAVRRLVALPARTLAQAKTAIQNKITTGAAD